MRLEILRHARLHGMQRIVHVLPHLDLQLVHALLQV